MKTKNRTFKIILLLTLSILMIAIMAIFPLVNTASAEAEINTTDEYIFRNIEVGDNLSGKTIYFDISIIDTLLFEDAHNIQFGSMSCTLTVRSLQGINLKFKNGETDIIIFNSENYQDITSYNMPDNLEPISQISYDSTNSFNWSFISILVENPDYIEPEPTEEPENPINEITDFFSNASVAAIILLVLGAYVVYSIIKK